MPTCASSQVEVLYIQIVFQLSFHSSGVYYSSHIRLNPPVNRFLCIPWQLRNSALPWPFSLPHTTTLQGKLTLSLKYALRGRTKKGGGESLLNTSWTANYTLSLIDNTCSEASRICHSRPTPDFLQFSEFASQVVVALTHLEDDLVGRTTVLNLNFKQGNIGCPPHLKVFFKCPRNAGHFKQTSTSIHKPQLLNSLDRFSYLVWCVFQSSR